jgi:hypothetical protein
MDKNKVEISPIVHENGANVKTIEDFVSDLNSKIQELGVNCNEDTIIDTLYELGFVDLEGEELDKYNQNIHNRALIPN